MRSPQEAPAAGPQVAAGTTEDRTESRRVWCVVYDSPTPNMDGSATPLRMAEQSREQAERNYAFMLRQERVAPKRNLRIETRLVTEWTRVDGSDHG